MNNMRKLIFVLFGLFIVNITSAQQDPQFSLNMFNNGVVNPGYSGTNGMICASAINRMQWLGFNDGEGAPKTVAFNINAPLEDINSGVGLNVVDDRLGFEKNFMINLNYSYILEDIGIRGSQLGIGVSLGMYNKSIDGEWITPTSLNPSTGSQQNPYYDSSLPLTEAKTAFDAGFGVWYRTNDLYFGFSTTHLLETEFKFNNPKVPSLKRHYYITAGYHMKLPNPLFELKPSVYIKTEFATTTASLGARVIYNKQFWGGAAFRIGSADAATAMIGMTLPNNIGIGIAYDISLSTIGSYNSGSVEFMLRYCFSMSGSGGKSKYGSVRFL